MKRIFWTINEELEVINWLKTGDDTIYTDKIKKPLRWLVASAVKQYARNTKHIVGYSIWDMVDECLCDVANSLYRNFDVTKYDGVSKYVYVYVYSVVRNKIVSLYTYNSRQKRDWTRHVSSNVSIGRTGNNDILTILDCYQNENAINNFHKDYNPYTDPDFLQYFICFWRMNIDNFFWCGGSGYKSINDIINYFDGTNSEDIPVRCGEYFARKYGTSKQAINKSLSKFKACNRKLLKNWMKNK